MISIVLNRDDTVFEVRQSLEELLGFEVNQLKCQRRLLDDSETIGSLGIAADSAIFVNPQVTSGGKSDRLRPRSCPMLQPVRVPPLQPLPPRSTGWTREAIDGRIDRLADLGFARDQCEIALKTACFNIDRAADYLVAGFVPDHTNDREQIPGNAIENKL
jgi:UV excision repair protein RAD23